MLTKQWVRQPIRKNNVFLTIQLQQYIHIYGQKKKKIDIDINYYSITQTNNNIYVSPPWENEK